MLLNKNNNNKNRIRKLNCTEEWNGQDIRNVCCWLIRFDEEATTKQVQVFSRTSSSSSTINTSKRQFSHLRLIILLTTALNTLDIKTKTSQDLYHDHFQNDLEYCRKCFQTQSEPCRRLWSQISSDVEVPLWRQILTILPQASCKRNNQLLTLQGSDDRVIAKYFANTKEHLSWTSESAELKKNFLQRESLEGMQFYPLSKVDNFINEVKRFHEALPKVTLWLYLSVNVQPVLMPILYELEFPVPKTYGVCGFTLYQEYIGMDLYHFYNKDFETKLKIAQHLLEAALQFSFGFGDYRLYITDLTADNIVYDPKSDKLLYIDLDTVFVVDFKEAKYKSSIHKHEYIECPGCFAYSPTDIADHYISDINIYSSCQFLREDLYKDKTKGFLYPIEEQVAKHYPQILETLNRCVDCPPGDCYHRFDIAKELLNIFEEILHDYNKK